MQRNMHSSGCNPLRDTPKALTYALTEFGGTTPWGQPMWRVVRAENVRELRFGTMRHMPRVSAESDIADLMEVEPERFQSGAMWLPRYDVTGWILERWFPPETWGAAYEWESTLAEDGVTRSLGDFPRHGDYFMVGTECYAELPGIEFWKHEISRLLREQMERVTDPAEHLGRLRYRERVAQENRQQAFLEEVNHLHRGVIEPLTMKVGRTAQRVRDDVAAEYGIEGHLSAG